jgi:hypothetical protein
MGAYSHRLVAGLALWLSKLATEGRRPTQGAASSPGSDASAKARAISVRVRAKAIAKQKSGHH